MMKMFFILIMSKDVGIASSNPQETLSVSGNVASSGFYYGDGSYLSFTSKFKGSDNYNFLYSDDFKAIVVSIDATGQIVIGNQDNFVDPLVDTHVYGSLFAQDHSTLQYDVISGAGARWIWNSNRNILRIGEVPSDTWDDNMSGDHSVAFGYATMATGNRSFVGGGYYNYARADDASVFGGWVNDVTGERSIILGGQNNMILDVDSIILGGRLNQAYQEALVLGGESNKASGVGSVVYGKNNEVSGNQSVILGGQNNIIDANQSVALGSNIQIDHDDVVIMSLGDNSVSSTVSKSIQLYAQNGIGIQTSDTQSGKLSIDGDVVATT